jgi:hypothetical protein
MSTENDESPIEAMEQVMELETKVLKIIPTPHSTLKKRQRRTVTQVTEQPTSRRRKR